MPFPPSQCIKLEQQGITDGSISIDSDLFFLGSRQLLMVDDWTKKGKGYILHRPKVLAHLTNVYGLDHPMTDHEAQILGLLCGNDYLDSAYGEVTLQRAPKGKPGGGKFAAFLADPPSVLREIDKNPRISSPEALWSTAFHQMLSFWKHAPCFLLTSSSGSERLTSEQWLTEEYTVTLGCLNDLPPQAQFLTTCGFDHVAVLTANWSDKTVNPGCLKDCFLLKKWPRTGVPLRSLPLPVENGTVLQHGGVIDFDAIAANNIPTQILKFWLQVRQVFTGTMNSPDVVRKVAEIRALPPSNTLHRPTATILPDIEESVVAPPLSGPSPWLGGAAFLNVVRQDLPTITDDYVNQIFGMDLPSLRGRSLNLLDGHLNTTSFRISEGRLRGTDRKCYIVNAMSIASTQGKVYNVVMTFDDVGNFIPDGSSCKCVDGQLFCSHMLSFVETLSMMQKDETSYGDIVEILPEPIDGLQGMAVPLNYLLDILRESSRVKRANKKKNKEII